MECSHLRDSNDIIKVLDANRLLPLACSKCEGRESIWICVFCGSLNCGRYAEAHGLAHFQENPSHSVCMETQELSVFCYACDDFIINDTSEGALDQLRSSLRAPLDEKKARILRPRRSKRSPSSFDSLGGVENKPKRRKKDAQALSKMNASPKKSLVGLRNLGNTCFMSAVLQSLSNIQEFCRVLKQIPSFDQKIVTSQRESRSKNAISTEGPIMTEELKKVLVALNAGQETKKAFSPGALFMVIWKVVPRFRGYQQQDAHEFLRYMLDRLHTELLSLLPSDLSHLQQKYSPYSCRTSTAGSRGTTSSHSLVTSIFGGMLQSEVTCLVCNASSKKHDPFLDLSIDIPNKFIQLRKAKNNIQQNLTNQTKLKSDSKEQNPTCHLHDCLEKFVDVEELADSERFFCGSCKNKQRSTKKFWIRRLPNVLCLHIKRFRWSPYSRTKLDTHVSFPLSGLDMSDYLLTNLHETRCSNAGSSLYDLAAVIVHHGSGAGSGHYTAFVIKNNNWYHFNDSTVLASDSETVLKSKAYILFYIQREFRQPGFSKS
uniref:Ubiquitin carboxyl-terminal hydrolase n=3 Tax=Lepeophtheirus salmonis TaxID=72036 RepID=A0A0K2VCM1_LEPSM